MSNPYDEWFMHILDPASYDQEGNLKPIDRFAIRCKLKGNEVLKRVTND
jgi:hypothetical protein